MRGEYGSKFVPVSGRVAVQLLRGDKRPQPFSFEYGDIDVGKVLLAFDSVDADGCSYQFNVGDYVVCSKRSIVVTMRTGAGSNQREYGIVPAFSVLTVLPVVVED